MEAERRDQLNVGGAEVGVDFGCEEVVDIGARAVGRFAVGVIAVDDVVGRMLVGPRGAAAVLVDHGKYGIGAHEIVRPHRRAATLVQLPRQFVRVDRYRAIEPGQARRHAAVDRMLVGTEIFRESDLGAWPGFAGLRRIAGRREQLAVVAVVVEDAVRLGRSTGDLGEQAGKRIRRFGGRCVGVDHGVGS